MKNLLQYMQAFIAASSITCLATTATGSISVVFSEGSLADEIAYTISGSDTWQGGAIPSTDQNQSLLPTEESDPAFWRTISDSPWGSVAPFKSVIGTVALTEGSTFEMFVDGNLINNSGGIFTGNDLRITSSLGNNGAFSWNPISGPNFWEYPALMGGETISWSGSGSFITPGGLSGNMNVGTFSYTENGGITFEAIVIPEPSAYTALLGMLAIVLATFRRRRMRGSEA